MLMDVTILGNAAQKDITVGGNTLYFVLCDTALGNDLGFTMSHSSSYCF